VGRTTRLLSVAIPFVVYYFLCLCFYTEEIGMSFITFFTQKNVAVACFECDYQWRTGGGGGSWGVQTPPPPRNSEGPPKSYQTQPDCDLLNLGRQHPKMFEKMQ